MKTDTVPDVLPRDEHNRRLISNVHPHDRQNPVPVPVYNLVVIGAGTAGLVSAAGAAGLGAKVALVERHLLGGDCLNVGCVPSKSVIRSSRVAAEVRDAARCGIHSGDGVQADFSAVMERMRRLRAQISENDSVKRFTDLGIDVFLGDGRFVAPDAVEVGEHRLTFKKAVIAAGASPVHPPIEGLKEAGFLTNETVFSLTELPGHFVVLGGGPIGSELAQAFSRLGSHVTIIGRSQLLSREDPDASDLIARIFTNEGIRFISNSTIKKVNTADGRKVVTLDSHGSEETVEADEILIATGRVPNVYGLNLESAGVEYDERHGVRVNDRLQTTNPRIYAAGDVCMAHKFTHAADAAARIVIQNALFKGRKKLSALTMPWCTYTDPEIAHVGVYERDAAEKGITLDTFEVRLDNVDRALLDGEEDGFVKIHTKRGTDKILGATIVARHAGDMISEISVAMTGNVGLGKLSGVIHPYPTQAEAIKKAADAYSRTRLTPGLKKIFARWMAWQRG